MVYSKKSTGRLSTVCLLLGTFSTCSVIPSDNDIEPDLSCPESCTCSPTDYGGYHVDCASRGFQMFPPTFPPEVEEVNFNGNHLTVLARENFTSLTQLYTLQAMYNDISVILEDTFVDLVDLTEVRLSKNPLHIVSLENCLCSLHIFPGFYTIVEFEAVFEHDQVELSHETLQCLEGKELYYLSLQHNNFRSFENGVFSGMKIDNLILENTTSEIYFNTNAFLGMEILGNLNLRQNGLRNFPNFTGFGDGNFPNLTSLYIGGNAFGSLAIWNMEGLSSLVMLSMNKNLVGGNNLYIQDGTFSELQNVKYFTYVDNSLDLGEEAQMNVFQSNSISNLAVDGLDLYHFNQNINSSKISHLFSSVKHLLSLSAKRLNFDWFLGDGKSIFWSVVFQNISTLTRLDLSHNVDFEQVPQMFNGLTKLQYLDLSHGEISAVIQDIFYPLVSLRTLDLSYNKLTLITQESFPHIGQYLLQISPLRLEGNPMNCSCGLRWFLTFTRTHTEIVPDLASTFCHYPPPLINKALINFEPDYQTCVLKPISPGYFIAIVGSCALLTILIVVAFTYKFRWHIRYLIFRLKLKYRVKESHTQLNVAYKYDAFVSYHDESLKWVKQHLLLKMEKDWGLKLCLHDRDWIIGQDIVQNIVDSIQNSRKVILIINNAFARSQWCQLELTLAQHHLLENERDNLILVLLEDIYDFNMVPRLSMQLKSNRKVTWTDDKTGCKLFYKQLLVLLERPSIIPRLIPV